MEKIPLELGSGGKMMRDFIENVILDIFKNPALDELSDAAHLPGQTAFTTDSYVVDPIFFPGGDIGSLCVNGTVNDLVVSGAEPLFLSLALILEEGMDFNDLKIILNSAKTAAHEAGVQITTGDTKVVKKGQGDKIYINTAGIGRVLYRPDPSKIKKGDRLIVTGTLGEHSIAVMLSRGDFGLESNILSDCAPLNFLLPVWEEGTLWMRDITRGGLATVLCELAEKIPYCIVLEEEEIPLSRPVKGATELLGIDPLYLACEGRALLVVPENKSEKILAEIKKDPLGQGAKIIGRIDVTPGKAGELILSTLSGGLRRLEPLTSELLPRIC
ncbi:MAG: hydrogenase expression/formation protein HypE [Candidatus Aminicenantes bacterium]|nr:hydrogenase expression/formation protein HypE [Candidatus Aminicenantes bacterium]